MRAEPLGELLHMRAQGLVQKCRVSPQGSLYYDISENFDPQRETLVFLHGLFNDAGLFEQQARYFMGRYNLILWDAPGHGRSRPYRALPYSGMAEALLAVFRELELESAVVIGHSMGGFVAQYLMEQKPEVAKACIFICSPPFS